MPILHTYTHTRAYCIYMYLLVTTARVEPDQFSHFYFHLFQMLTSSRSDLSIKWLSVGVALMTIYTYWNYSSDSFDAGMDECASVVKNESLNSTDIY